MRIISGERRGLRLEAPPKSNPARPTEDKIKEAVFNILQPIRKGARCLDLFAATGQIGLEFLSRGADSCVFSEKSAQLVPILKRNIDKAHYTESSSVLIGDFRRNIARMEGDFDYVYIDAPYYFHMERVAMEALLRYRRLRSDALIVIERGSAEEMEEVAGVTCVFQRIYHTKCIEIYKEKK